MCVCVCVRGVCACVHVSHIFVHNREHRGELRLENSQFKPFQKKKKRASAETDDGGGEGELAETKMPLPVTNK